MSEFQLISKNNLSYLSFIPFERSPNLKHAFSMKLTPIRATAKQPSRFPSQSGDDHSEEDFLRTMDIAADSLVTLKQVHGNQCRIISKRSSAPIQGMEGDCLLTSDHGIALGVRTADCFPVLMFDHERKVISCTHAGWRSLTKRILDDCLGMMIQNFSCRPSSIVAAIGPGIDTCCYTVKEDVIEQFEKNRISVSSSVSQNEDRSFSLNLKGIILDQLMKQGLSRSNIHLAPFCTHCSSLPLPSFRREGKKAGRALSVIMLTEDHYGVP